MINLIPLADSGETHFAKELFEAAFPEAERPPFEELKHRGERFHFMVATNDDDPIGILTYWDFDEFVYVEHFAIDEDLRDQGLGKAVFLNFLSATTEQVVLEVEPPHDETSEHRIEFYISMGLNQNPQEYWQPSYRNPQKLELPMVVLSKLELSDEDFSDIRTTLYTEVYHRNSKKIEK